MMFFGWENFKKAFLEWIKTFSNEKSFLSAKRINRFVLTATGLGLTIFVVIYNKDKFTATDNMIVIGPLFVYAGYEVSKTEKEKQFNKTIQNENNP
jgi:hypothetical protein